MKLSILRSKIFFEDAEFSHGQAVDVMKLAIAQLAKSGIVLPNESDIYNMIGEGAAARVYDFGNKVVKITDDESDAQAWFKVSKLKHPNLPRTFDVFNTDVRHHGYRDSDIPDRPDILYVIVQEKINTEIPIQIRHAAQVLDAVPRNYSGDEITALTATKSEIVETLTAFGITDPNAVNEYIKNMFKLQTILRSIRSYAGIEPVDVHDENWGRRGDILVLLDLGGCKMGHFGMIPSL